MELASFLFWVRILSLKIIHRNQNENVNTSGDDRSDSDDVMSDNETEHHRASVANRPTNVVTLLSFV